MLSIFKGTSNMHGFLKNKKELVIFKCKGSKFFSV